MEKIKVSLNKVKYSLRELAVTELSERAGSLYITTSNDLSEFVSVGTKIHFTRVFDNDAHEKCDAIVTVLDVVDKYNIVTSIPTTRGYITMSLLDYNENYSAYTPSKTNKYYIDFSDDIKIFDEDLYALKKDICIDNYTITITRNDGEAIILSAFTNEYPGRIQVKMTGSEYDTLPETCANIKFSQNEFYGKDIAGEGRLWSNIVSGSTTKITVDDSKLKVPFLLGDRCDDSHMMEEEYFNNLYESVYDNGLIPSTIDMEKIRYIPIVKPGTSGNVVPLTKINFNFFFRVKESGWTSTIDDDYIWNQFSGMPENKITLPDVLLTNSDNLSLLTFTDDDVYYQKLKLQKSFIRLSFYTSNDSLSQKLIGYSTIYFDTKRMYTEYLSVKCASAITSQISVTNCYDTTKSSEGFYIYLFKSDSPLENEEKTIYMKVEFNHAKYGKTTPMIAYKLEKNSTLNLLKPSNYFDNLYIPVKLKYINNTYVYYFDNTTNLRTLSNSEPDVMDFYLFEPKLHAES